MKNKLILRISRFIIANQTKNIIIIIINSKIKLLNAKISILDKIIFKIKGY